MPLTLIDAPSAEPVSLANVRAQLGITEVDATLDANLTRRITSARAWAENFTERAFINQTWELVLDCFPGNVIELARGKLQSITSIKYLDTNGVQQTLDSSKYVLDTDSEPGRVYPAYGESWPSTQSIENSVRIRFVVGYGTDGSAVPNPIKEAVLIAIGHWTNYQASDEYGVTMTRVPFAAEALLQPYRMMGF